MAASQSVPGKRRVGESLSPGAVSARERHCPDSGRETEGSQAWSLFHPKCVNCHTGHQAQKNGSSVSGVVVPCRSKERAGRCPVRAAGGQRGGVREEGREEGLRSV